MSERVLLLGIDTSQDGELALAQIRDDGRLVPIAEQQLNPRRQSAEIMTRLEALLTDARASLHQVQAIVVVSGPGSFTGVRIGLSAAKGLAEAAAIPLIDVSTLAVMAHDRLKDTVTVINAGRREYYVGRGMAGSALPCESLETEATLQAIIAGADVVTASPEMVEKLSAAASVSLLKPSAYRAILAALPRLHARDFADIATLDANYVRRPYTEIALEAKPAP